MMRVALDSNILAYLAEVERLAADEAKIQRTKALLRSFRNVSLIAPVQALGELFVVLRKSGASSTDARLIVQRFAEDFGCPASERATALAAADLVVDHKLQYWDALIVSAAVDAGCALLLSEDMQHGFVTRGLTIVNPLAEPAHPKLAALMAEPQPRGASASPEKSRKRKAGDD
jgi:predicted nucleic acid-binding protein